MYVLVIDDDPMICKTAGFLLREAGYEVDEATSGRAALAMIDRREPDLIVLDLVLSDVSSLEIFQRVRRSTADIRVLFLMPEGYVTDSSDGLVLNDGVLLRKPFTPDEFTSHVHSLAWRRLTCSRDADRIRVGNAVLHAGASRLVINNGSLSRLVNLAPSEVDLLRCLMLNPGREVSGDVLRGGMLEIAREAEVDGLIDGLIHGLLGKIGRSASDSAFDPAYIESLVPGAYKFNVITA